MSAGDKAIILAQVENQSRGKRQALMALGIPKSSYMSILLGLLVTVSGNTCYEAICAAVSVGGLLLVAP